MKALIKKIFTFCITTVQNVRDFVLDILNEPYEDLCNTSRLGWDGICPGCNKWLHHSCQGKCIEVTETSYLYACNGCKTLSAWDVVTAPCPLPDKKFAFDKSLPAKEYKEKGYVFNNYEKGDTV